MNKPEPNILENLAFAIGNAQKNSIPGLLPEDAPFTNDQRQWLNGLLAGLHAVAVSATLAQDQAQEVGTALTVLYGSQSGTAESLSKDLKKYAKTQGFEADIKALDDIELSSLADINHLLIIAATFGEGEPTDNAVSFYKTIMADDAPELPATLNYAVCGLGDSSYAQYNQAGKDIDRRLAELGATRVSELVACDVAYEDDYANWKQAAFEAEAFKSAAGAASAPLVEVAEPAFDKNHPFMANLLHSECLSATQSTKKVNHIEISLAGGGEDLDYAVGDALGVWPVNCPTEVQAILQATGFNGTEPVKLKSGPARLSAALLTKLDLTTVTPTTADTWRISEIPEGAQAIDLLRQLKPVLTPQTLIDGLRPLQPRLYSISSSPKKHPGEVHLTVGEVHYTLDNSHRKGCASTFLGDRLSPGGSVGVYVQKSAHFHIPENDDVPLIMIGPGTGIAPFRAFLEEREVRKARGRNWLFFGDQHEANDFLYKDEIHKWMENGLLTRADFAWSRDGAEKVYVQHKLLQAGQEVYQWLQDGAAIYVCGDASRMAADVDQAIKDVISQYGGLIGDAAAAYVDDLAKNHRYQRDVY